MAKISRTTEHHFKIFQEEALKWIEFFGLKGWTVDFEHKKGDEARADFYSIVGNRSCLIRLFTDWSPDPVTDNDVRKSAFHEVIEGLLLIRLIDVAESRFCGSEDVKEACHEIVRTLENTVWKL